MHNLATRVRHIIYNIDSVILGDHLKIRALDKHISRAIRASAMRLSGVTEEDAPDPLPGKRGNCKYCKRRKTRYFCKMCKSWLCMEHIKACCQECLAKLDV